MACLLVRGTHEQLNRMAGVSPSTKPFTPTQGQYLAFIHLYARLHRRSPAETDIQEYFRVSLPSVHQMVLTLERAGLITRQPKPSQHRGARSFETLARVNLNAGHNPSKSLSEPPRQFGASRTMV